MVSKENAYIEILVSKRKGIVIVVKSGQKVWFSMLVFCHLGGFDMVTQLFLKKN